MADLARDTALTAVADIDGWLTPGESALLFDLARRCPANAVVVEIGSWRGKSTVLLASGVRSSGGRVFAIDPHEGTTAGIPSAGVAALTANLERAGVSDAVTPIVARSADAAATFDRPIDLLFIDGDHAEASARRDIGDWLPKVVPGGRVAFHDIVNPIVPGARRALIAALWRSHRLGRVGFVDSIAYAECVEVASMRDRASNWMAAIALTAYGLRPATLRGPLRRALAAAARLTPIKR